MSFACSSPAGGMLFGVSGLLLLFILITTIITSPPPPTFHDCLTVYDSFGSLRSVDPGGSRWIQVDHLQLTTALCTRSTPAHHALEVCTQYTVQSVCTRYTVQSVHQHTTLRKYACTVHVHLGSTLSHTCHDGVCMCTYTLHNSLNTHSVHAHSCSIAADHASRAASMCRS